MVIASALAAVAALRGREEFYAARNRRNETVASWRTSGCAAELRAGIDDVIGSASEARRLYIWRQLDVLVDSLASTTVTRCTVSAQANGSALDVNNASEETIAKF